MMKTQNGRFEIVYGASRDQMCVPLRRKIVCGLAVIGLSMTLSAVEHLVGSVPELVDALKTVSASTTYDTITIRQGTYDVSGITPMSGMAFLAVTNTSAAWRDVVIQGDPAVAREQVVLDAGGKGRVLHAYCSGRLFRLKNLTIRNGKSTDIGGGVRTEGSGEKFYFENCAFVGNAGVNKGGAVAGSNYQYFTDCLFATNSLTGSSGGGAAVNSAKSISGCRFVGNSISGDSINGGAFYGGCLITNCEFYSNCNTGRWGRAGAVYLTSGGGIVDCIFSNNYCAGSCKCGGAVAIAANAACISNSTFLCNDAGTTTGGGAIAVNTDTATAVRGEIVGCKFVGNTALAYHTSGGAVLDFGGLIKDCEFVANRAYYGAGVGNCANVARSVFAGNISTSGSGEPGGGSAYKSALSDHCIVTNNTASYQFAGLYGCRICDSFVSGNSTARGDLIQESEGTTFIRCEVVGTPNVGDTDNNPFQNCAFSECIVSNYEAHYLTHGSVAATNCLFAYNKCPNGLFRLISGVDNAFVNCSFVANTYGGLVVQPNTGSAGRVVNCMFYGRGADDVGPSGDLSIPFTNCYLSTTRGISGDGNINLRGGSSPAPRLMGDRDPSRPFAPSRKSVLNGNGLVMDWMADATDLDGHPRLTNGNVAIGCYETTDTMIPGLMLMVR